MVFVGFIAVLLVVCVSLFGWGTLANRLTRSPVRNTALIVIIGLGVFVFLGGVLNLLRLAYGWAFDGLILGGMVLSVSLNRTFRPSLPKNKGEWLYVLSVGLVISLIIGFTIGTQLPPRAFNFHDDFEKYFAYPVRMLETGTLFGSPLSSIGLETLGGEAVLHGIIVNHFPIYYINGVDAVFGLLLCLLLPVSIIPRRLAFLPVALTSMIVVFCINPQYVNVSALYIASAFMMTSILLFSQDNENKNDDEIRLPSPVLTGLMYAALLALKSSFLPFPALQFILFCITLGLLGGDIRRLLRWGLTTIFLSLLFLSPWFLLHLPHYLQRSSSTVLNAAPVSYQEELNLFSTSPLFYGASFASYTILALAAALPVLVILLWKLKERTKSNRDSLAGIASSSATVIISYLFIVGLGPRLNSYDVNLRYTIPYLIAGAPALMTLSCVWALRENSGRFKLYFLPVLLVFALLIIAGFTESVLQRTQQAFQSGNILAFSELATNPLYLEYSDDVLHGTTRLRLAEAQRRIPAGQAFVAWVSTPFYFDYRRNIVFDADPSGLVSPWAYTPRDVEYFIMEYNGFAVHSVSSYYNDLNDPGRRQNAECCLGFLRTVQELSQNADTLYNDGKIVVFRTKKKIE